MMKDWILCNERLLEERDSIFAKFKGTDKWKNGMFEKNIRFSNRNCRIRKWRKENKDRAYY